MKKKKQKKAGSKKEDKSESASEPGKDEPADATTEAAPNVVEKPEENVDESKEQEDTVPETTPDSRQRQPSLSLQSKMRSSSFRQSAGGSPTPGFAVSPDGGTAPDIYRKQAARIEELEKENKRLAKEASDGERRWKKAEEELEDLREADDSTDVKPGAASSPGSDAELEKLVWNISSQLGHGCITIANRCAEI